MDLAAPEADFREDASASRFLSGYAGEAFAHAGRFGNDDFDNLLDWCAARKASDITLQTDERAKAEFDGRIHPVTARPLNASEVEEIVRYGYGENAVAEIKAGHDLDFRHEVKMPSGVRMRYRVNATGCRIPGGDGISITIRTLPRVPPTLAELGVEQDLVDNIRPAHGMVLVTGPTGQGKSTLLAAIDRHLLERPGSHEKIVEFASPIEYTFDGIETDHSIITQTEVPRHLRPREGSQRGYAYAVRNALRRKPTVIQIGEAREEETMEACIEAALTGHVLYSTIHTIGVPETIRRVVRMFPQEMQRTVAVDAMEAMRVIVTQLLAPSTDGGRVAVREYFVFDPSARAQFLREDFETWPQLARKLLREGRVVGCSLSESAARLLEEGRITERTYEYTVTREKER